MKRLVFTVYSAWRKLLIEIQAGAYSKGKDSLSFKSLDAAGAPKATHILYTGVRLGSRG